MPCGRCAFTTEAWYTMTLPHEGQIGRLGAASGTSVAVAVFPPPSHMTSPTLAWFVVHGKFNRERSIDVLLRTAGFETFLPTCRIKRRWSDRLKEIAVPLFPGYIFCKLDVREKLSILKVPGVISLIGIGKEPLPLSNEEVDNIRIMVESGFSVYPWPYVQLGATVVISEGPLRGLRAIVLEEDASRRRLIVSVELLNRSIAVDIAPEWATVVRPVSPGRKLGRHFPMAA